MGAKWETMWKHTTEIMGNTQSVLDRNDLEELMAMVRGGHTVPMFWSLVAAMVAWVELQGSCFYPKMPRINFDLCCRLLKADNF